MKRTRKLKMKSGSIWDKIFLSDEDLDFVCENPTLSAVWMLFVAGVFIGVTVCIVQMMGNVLDCYHHVIVINLILVLLAAAADVCFAIMLINHIRAISRYKLKEAVEKARIEEEEKRFEENRQRITDEISAGEWSFPRRELYIRLSRAGISALDDDFSSMKAKLVAEKMLKERGIHKGYESYVAEERLKEYFADGLAIIEEEKKQALEKAGKNVCFHLGVPLDYWQREEIEEAEKVSELEGREKRRRMLNYWISEEQNHIRRLENKKVLGIYLPQDARDEIENRTELIHGLKTELDELNTKVVIPDSDFDAIKSCQKILSVEFEKHEGKLDSYVELRVTVRNTYLPEKYAERLAVDGSMLAKVYCRGVFLKSYALPLPVMGAQYFEEYTCDTAIDTMLVDAVPDDFTAELEFKSLWLMEQ